MLNEFLNIYESGLRDANASLTIPEAIHRIVEKINLLIRHFNLLEDNVNGSIDDFSEKIEYYLNNGMIDEVSKKLDQFVKDGTLATIINEQIFTELNNQITNIKSDISAFKELYNTNKTNTDNAITANTNAIAENGTKIQKNTDEINKVSAWVTTVESKVTEIKNDYSTTQIVYPTTSGVVQKYVLHDDKMAKIKKYYIDCYATAKQWQQAWEDINNTSNNNNGSFWIPFYWSLTSKNIIDATMTFRKLNKWVWQSLGYSKIGIYGIGAINDTGCYVYVENKKPDEQTIELTFTVCITETYQ